MALQSNPLPRFSRQPVRHQQPELLESTCLECGLRVGASMRPDTLTLAEQLHICPVYLNYKDSKQPRA